ncbi:CD1871A family CXXC motif-containing protein [Mageeibacillus indolicus]
MAAWEMERCKARAVRMRRIIGHIGQARYLGVAFVVLGLIFMGFGIYRGEVEIVLAKAVRVCMECIGIG